MKVVGLFVSEIYRCMFLVYNLLQEDQKNIIITLEKVNQTWWENVLTHHPKIDTSKIEPPNSKLSDLDSETR